MKKHVWQASPMVSTKSGIAPFYSDKFAKIGFQASELFDDEVLEEKVQKVCELKMSCS